MSFGVGGRSGAPGVEDGAAAAREGPGSEGYGFKEEGSGASPVRDAFGRTPQIESSTARRAQSRPRNDSADRRSDEDGFGTTRRGIVAQRFSGQKRCDIPNGLGYGFLSSANLLLHIVALWPRPFHGGRRPVFNVLARRNNRQLRKLQTTYVNDSRSRRVRRCRTWARR